MRKSSYVKIGAFVCAAILLVVLAVILMGSGSMRKRELLMETYVEETVQGVSEGSAVKYRGIPVGTVKSVSFAGADYKQEDALPDAPEADLQRAIRYARVVFALDTTDLPDEGAFVEYLDKQIDGGLRAHMKSQGITGLVYIDLDFEDPGKPTLPVPWKPKHLYIPTAPSLTKTLTDVVQNVAQEIHGLSDLKTGVSNVIVRLSTLIDNGNATLVSADASLVSANATLGALPGLIAGASNLVSEATAFLRDAQDDMAYLPGILSGTSNLVYDASAFLDSVKGDVADVAASSTNFLAGADITVAGLRTPLESTLDDLSRASRNLADILDAIRDDPGRLFKKPAEENMP